MTVEQDKDSRVKTEALYCLNILSQQLSKDKSETKRENQTRLFTGVKTDQNNDMIKVLAECLTHKKTAVDCKNVI